MTEPDGHQAGGLAGGAWPGADDQRVLQGYEGVHVVLELDIQVGHLFQIL